MLVRTSLKPKSAVAAGEDFQGEVAIMKRKNRATWLHLPRSVDCDKIAVKDACSAKTPEVAAANVFDMKNMGIKCISLDEVEKEYK